MQIEIDFEVFKALTAKLTDESDSYNEAIRRLLGMPATEVAPRLGEIDTPGLPGVTRGLGGETGGVWFSNVFFPDGTWFRATYKGKTYRAWINKSQWVDELGNVRTSPSDAASAISNTNVNGWRFWFVRRPHDEDWVRMDALKQ
ncbi:MAG: hypothetical protein ACTS1X_07865 [Parasphingopyxis sp.]|uniref:hypothetical protein n=1 Tax=Parasphingopyxis sp. TaxID=1920299 RepID=UPI003FA0809E